MNCLNTDLTEASVLLAMGSGFTVLVTTAHSLFLQEKCTTVSSWHGGHGDLQCCSLSGCAAEGESASWGVCFFLLGGWGRKQCFLWCQWRPPTSLFPTGLWSSSTSQTLVTFQPDNQNSYLIAFHFSLYLWDSFIFLKILCGFYRK